MSKSKSNVNVLVIGGDGFLGSNFSRHLAQEKIRHTATSRKKHYKYLNSKKFFNLEKWQDYSLKGKFTHAVIFAGISGYERCQKDSKSWDINVSFTLGLASNLMERGVNVTMISSSAVFSSTTENGPKLVAMALLMYEEHLAYAPTSDRAITAMIAHFIFFPPRSAI